MSKTKKIFISLAIFSMLIMPIFSVSAYDLGDPIIPCGQSVDGDIAYPCDFKYFLGLVNNVIGFIFKGLVIPIAAIMFFYAGFKLITSGGSTEARGQAKNIFTNAVIGLVVAAGAWLIIKAILVVLGYEGGWIGF